MDENEGIGGDYLKGGVGFEIHGQILRICKILEGFERGERGREEGRKSKGLGGVGVCGVGVGGERGWGQPKWNTDCAAPTS